MIQAKVEFLAFETAKEESLAENLRAEEEIKGFYSEMESLDNEANIMAKEMPKEIIKLTQKGFIQQVLNLKSIQLKK